MAATVRHETRALLRAHLSAASGYRHLTHRCPICHRLLRLAMEPAPHGEDDPETACEAMFDATCETACEAVSEDGSPSRA